MIAFTNSDFCVEEYTAYEIDEYAIKTSEYNFPEIEQRGDVFEADFTEFYDVDYVIGGSPCTFWSVAQNPKTREKEASGVGWELFKQYARAIKEACPKYFIYENNKSMTDAVRDSISEKFGFEPICINSALLSAQSRQRLYWVGKRNADFTYSKVDIIMPLDMGILLKDIIDINPDECNKVFALNTAKNSKSQAIKAQYHKTGIANIIAHKNGFGATGVAELVNPLKSGKSRCVTASYAYKSGKHILESNFSNNKSKQTWDSVALPFESFAVPTEFDGDVPIKAISKVDGKPHIVYKVENGLITVNGSVYPIELSDGYYIIRKLTVRECARLQTIPDWYVFPVSDTRAYRLIGNGWTVSVISWLLEHTKEYTLPDDMRHPGCY